MAFMSCLANVRTVGKNKTGDAPILALRHIFVTIVAVEKQ
jgi:hypothetical protein